MVAAVYLVVAFLTSYQNYSPTPQQAAIRAVYYPHSGQARIVRANVVGNFAVVLTRGGTMEGSPVREAILVERFSFGWQPLQLVDSDCSLDRRAINVSGKRLLMLGMPKPQGNGPCPDFGRDAGPRADVEAVRKQIRGPLIPSVAVAGKYALASWYGGGGGEWLFRRDRGRWRWIFGGGGALGVQDVRQYGVPQSAWCALGIYNARCRTNQQASQKGRRLQ